jgi:hypothetical protein
MTRTTGRIINSGIRDLRCAMVDHANQAICQQLHSVEFFE